jgi:hypothetical protein
LIVFEPDGFEALAVPLDFGDEFPVVREGNCFFKGGVLLGSGRE